MENVVHVSERFNEDAGAYDVVYYLQNGKLETKYLTSRDLEPTPRVNASVADIALAKSLYIKQGLLREGRHMIGSLILLQRARKAPNKEPVRVIGYQERFYNGVYWQDSKIRVSWQTADGLVSAWVSENCIKQVLENPLDW